VLLSTQRARSSVSSNLHPAISSTLLTVISVIGGGIANFTNVASTFKGVIRALREVAPLLIEHNVKIWIRRAGPNYQEGLKNIKSVGQELGLDMHVYGPEMHVSGIVPLALIPGKTSDVKEFTG
jgi:ATP citrate (pro-S)-lyase